MRGTLRSYLGWAALFAAAILLVQVQSLVRETVYNSDESTFMLMAQDVLRGHLPYTVQFDNKPPGLFLALAASMKLFGQSLLVARATAWAWLFACALSTFAVARYLSGSRAAGMAVLLMIVCTPMFYGFHVGTEFPALAMAMLALWAMLRHRASLWGAALCGLSVSLAVILRTNFAYVAMALGAVYLVGALWRPLGMPRAAVVTYALGGILPPAILALVYASHGALGELYLSTIVVPLSYASHGMQWTDTLLNDALYVVQSLTYSPFAFTALVVLALLGYVRHLRSGLRTRSIPAITDWIVIALTLCALALSIVRGGAAYPHYVLQLFPFLALGAAMMLKAGLSNLDRLVIRGGCAIGIAAGLVANAPLSITAAMDLARGNVARPLQDAAAVIAADMQPGDRVWTVAKQLVGFYLDEPPITRFATHPDSVGNPAIMQPLIAAGYAPADLVGAMLALHARYVVTGPTGTYNYFSPADTARFEAALAADYRPLLRNDDVVVYRRND